MALFIAAVDLCHLRDQLAVDPRIASGGAHDEAHRLAVPAGDVPPAAFQPVVAAARRHFRADRTLAGGGGILHVTVGPRHAAAGKHRLRVVVRHLVAADEDVETRLANACRRHGRHAQVEAERGARHVARLRERRLHVVQQSRGNAERAAVAFEDERDVGVARRVQYRGDRRRGDGIDLLVIAGVHRRGRVTHVAGRHVPVRRQRREALDLRHRAEVGENRQVGVEAAHRITSPARATPSRPARAPWRRRPGRAAGPSTPPHPDRPPGRPGASRSRPCARSAAP